MGNCLILSKKCPWAGGLKDDAKYEFDPDKDITIEPKIEVIEDMKEIHSSDDEMEIQIGQQTSIENMNCTKIDYVSLEAKEQKEINNRTIKQMSDSGKIQETQSEILKDIEEEYQGTEISSEELSLEDISK